MINVSFSLLCLVRVLIFFPLLSFSSSYGWTHHHLLNIPKDLTDRIWNTISKPLIEHLERAKQNRLRQELEKRQSARQELIVPYYLDMINSLSLERAGLFPGILDFINFASVKSFWEPDDFEWTKQDWEKELPEMMIEVEASINRRKTSLFRNLAATLDAAGCSVKEPLLYTKLKSCSRYPPVDPKPTFSDEEMDPYISDVIARFTCIGCREIMTYQQLLVHFGSIHQETTSVKGYTPHYRHDWSDSSINENSIRGNKMLIALVKGNTEESMTEEEFGKMKELGEIFKCKDCVVSARQYGYYGGLQNDRAKLPFNSEDLVRHSISISLFLFLSFPF